MESMPFTVLANLLNRILLQCFITHLFSTSQKSRKKNLQRLYSHIALAYLFAALRFGCINILDTDFIQKQ